VFKVTMKNLRAHKRRLVSTSFAIFFGVAFLAGTMMLSDTIGKTFDDLFADVYRDTDAVVRSSSVVEGEFGSDDIRGRIPASLVDEVKDVDGVAEAEGGTQGYAQIVGTNGDVVGNPGMGPPTFGGHWSEIDELNPFNLVEGEPPAADDEVVIDRRSADKGDISVGDRIQVLTKDGPIEVTVVGIAKFGDADSPGGASFTLFTEEAAERYIGEPGMVDSISVLGESGVSQAELRDRIADALSGEDVEVLTGKQITEETQDDIADALSFFTIFLTVFAVVALVVSVFSIYNTFSIIVAQRTRDMALLRAVGASRRQVLGSVIGESAVLGLTASLLGVLGGVAIVYVLKAMLDAFGVDLPAGGLVLKASTVVVSLVVGFVVTVVAAVGPAVRASRVPPLAALRDVAIDRGGSSRLRLVLGVIVVLLGVAATFSALAGGGSNALFAAGGGVLLVLIGTIVLGPVVARPLSRLIGAPLSRFRGVTGHLAQENSARSPRRTANTAAALLVGVGVVGFFTVLSASIKHSIETIIDRSVTGDFVVDSGTFGGMGGLSPALAEDLNRLPEIDAASGVRYGEADLAGGNEFITAVDPQTFSQIVDTKVTEGSLEDLGDDGLAVFSDTAKEENLAMGDEVTVRFAQTGEQSFRVVAIFDRNDLTGDYIMSTDAFAANVPDQFDSQVYVTLASGVSMEEGRAAIESVADAYPQARVQDQEEFKDSQAAQINQLLGLVYAMLAFAIIIALMGIANTLSLSIHERTRELGLLRAVGMTRSQMRSSVRWESVIIAVFGTLGGLVIAVFFSWAAVSAADEEALTFTFPLGSLLILVVLAALAGVLAGLRPASRAAKLDVLRAIATE
jgi:putative ABC transport system permease protein